MQLKPEIGQVFTSRSCQIQHCFSAICHLLSDSILGLFGTGCSSTTLHYVAPLSHIFLSKRSSLFVVFFTLVFFHLRREYNFLQSVYTIFFLYFCFVGSSTHTVVASSLIRFASPLQSLDLISLSSLRYTS